MGHRRLRKGENGSPQKSSREPFSSPGEPPHRKSVNLKGLVISLGSKMAKKRSVRILCCTGLHGISRPSNKVFPNSYFRHRRSAAINHTMFRVDPPILRSRRLSIAIRSILRIYLHVRKKYASCYKKVVKTEPVRSFRRRKRSSCHAALSCPKQKSHHPLGVFKGRSRGERSRKSEERRELQGKKGKGKTRDRSSRVSDPRMQLSISASDPSKRKNALCISLRQFLAAAIIVSCDTVPSANSHARRP